jgi:carbon starvation protein
MTILPVVALAATVLVLGYRFYGRLVVKSLGVDPRRTTPADELNDGVDYVPASAGVVLGGHFTAIAAAGPVVGPIVAGYMFGWLPALIWILLGAIFVGGVHDSGALLASIRHKASSITQVVREHMSYRAYVTFLMFVWLSLIYVIIAFASVTASTFAQSKSFSVTTDGANQQFQINGGAVVIGAVAYLLCSIGMGIALRKKVPWIAALAISILAMIVVIAMAPQWSAWLSQWIPILDTGLYGGPNLARQWSLALLVYCFAASITPMWLLLQPRGSIGAVFLYAALFFGVVGTLIGGWSTEGALKIQWPYFKGFTTEKGATLFPILFITIACGACSGFHSIVASGTTSKQIRNESDIYKVGYGAMLLEAMVAVFSLTCLMILSESMITGKPDPDAIYAGGIGLFLHQTGISWSFAVMFGLLAFSSFVFDTLDVCTRLGRYVLQELTGLGGLWGGAIATFLTLVPAAMYIGLGPKDWDFRLFWTVFGTSNQLLAALTLLGVSVWLWRTGRPVWFSFLPALFMLFNTGWALIANFLDFTNQYLAASRSSQPTAPSLVNMGVAAVLFGLGLFVVLESIRVWRMTRANLSTEAR